VHLRIYTIRIPAHLNFLDILFEGQYESNGIRDIEEHFSASPLIHMKVMNHTMDASVNNGQLTYKIQTKHTHPQSSEL